MSELYADATTLRLGSGELCAIVRVDSTRPNRPKCLLVHGNPSSLADWERIVPELSRVAEICAIDLPGFGRSARADASPSCVSLERFAELLISVADALDWRDPIYIIGHSHGGGVAQLAAARYPARVAGIALLGTLGAPVHPEYRMLTLPGAILAVRFWSRLFASQRLRLIARPMLRAMIERVASPDAVSAERVERELLQLGTKPDLLVTMMHLALDNPCDQLFRAAPQIRCPVLFVHGAEDALVPPKYARNIHDRILASGGDSEFRLLPRAGHMLLDFQANEVLESIIHLLDRGRDASARAWPPQARPPRRSPAAGKP